VKPVVSRLKDEFAGRVEFRQLDIDDPANAAAKRQYGFRAQPQVVIIDQAGTVVVSRLSELTYRRLRDDLESVLDG
jgi:hypothetical protein